MTLYHIHRIQAEDIEKKWIVGNTIDFSKIQYNSFFEFSLNYKPLIYVNENELININCLIQDAINNNIYLNSEVLEIINKHFNEYQILTREIAYENVRLDKFKDLPSRTKCLWLCKEEQLEFWKEQLDGNFKIFKIETLEDNIFKTNNNFLCKMDDSYNEMLSMAEKYWSYSSEQDNDNDEYLYNGSFKIIEEITI